MIQSLTLAPGDYVVYPKHGPGVIRAVTERTLNGEPRAYYEIELRSGGMQMLVPVDSAATLGLRRVLSGDDAPRLLAIMTGDDLELPSAFQPRYRIEQAVLEAGDIEQLARLVGTLSRRQVQRGLASSESMVMLQAKKALTIELAVALELSEAEAGRLLDERLA